MSPSYNIYKIDVVYKSDGYTSKDFHKLVFLQQCRDLQSAEEWLKNNHEKWVSYTIIPQYSFTDFDGDPSF